MKLMKLAPYAALAAVTLLFSCANPTSPSADKPSHPSTCTLTLTSGDVNGTVSSLPGDTTIPYGTEITVTGTGNAGYSLASWQDDSGNEISTDNPYTFTITSNTSLVANFAAGYRIDTNVEHAQITCDPVGPVYQENDVVEVTITADPGYVFNQWTTGLAGTAATQEVTIGTSLYELDAQLDPRWRILVHIAADNNIDYDFEDTYGILTNYIETLEGIKAADTGDLLDIYVLMDGYAASDPAGAGYTTGFTDGYYKLSGGSFAGDLVKTTGEINSGSVAVTESFMKWAVGDSTAARTFYSVFNHGGGFDDASKAATYGIAFDDSADDALSHYELAQVTAYLKTLIGGNIDVFYPYACLMGGIELAWEVRNNADVLIASEEVFPAEEWSWEALSSILADSSISSVDLGGAFCDSAYDYFSDSTSSHERTFTLATVDLSKVAALSDALAAFATSATAWIGTDVTRATDFNNAAFDSLLMDTQYYLDIGDLMDAVDSEIGEFGSETAAVRSALSDAIVHFTTHTGPDNMGAHDDSTGLSIFHNRWLNQVWGYVYSPYTYASILDFGKTNAWTTYSKKMNSMLASSVYKVKDGYESYDETGTNVLSPGLENKQYHTFSQIYGDFDVDIMAVYLTAGVTYTFQTLPATVYCDTILSLYDSNQEYVGGNDDIDTNSGDYFSKLTYTPSASGPYYVAVYDYYQTLGDFYVYYGTGTWSAPSVSQSGIPPVKAVTAKKLDPAYAIPSFAFK